MSLSRFKQLMADGALVCPQCGKPIREFEKFVETTVSVWDGAGDSALETSGDGGSSKVTLICGNEGCSFRERTEYWRNYLSE